MLKFLLTVIILVFAYIGISFGQAQLNWQQTLSVNNTLAFALNPVDEKVIYATANGNFLVSIDDGLTWQTRNQLIPNIEIRNIAICPADTSIIIMYAAGNLLRSTNGGYDWDIVLDGVTMDGETIEFHPIQPDTVFFVDFYGGNLWVSADRGANWDYRANTALTTVCSYAINPNNPKLMIAGSGNTRINRSMDGGYTWETVKDGNDYFSETPKIKWDPTVADRAYGSNYLDKNYSVIKIEDGGSKWTRNGIYGINMWALDIDPTNGDVYLGTFGEFNNPGVYKSYDAGNSWQLFGNIPYEFVWMIKTANDSVVNALSLNGAFGQSGGGLYQLRIPEMGYLSGNLTDSVSGLAVEFYQIEVSSTGDKVYSGNSEGAYKLAMVPGTYSFTFMTGGLQKTIDSVVIEGGRVTELDVTMLLDIKELTLSGTIKGENNEPVSSIITLEYNKQTTENVIVSDSTDESGYYEIKNLYSLNQYNQLTISPLELPYFEKKLTSFEIDTLQNITVEYADILIANGSSDPAIAEKYMLALAKNELSSVSTDISAHPEYIDPQIIAKTKKNAIIWYSRIDSTSENTQTLDSLQSLKWAGSNIIMSGQNMIENNSSHSFFSDLSISHNGNYTIQGFADPVKGFANNAIAKDLNFIIRLPDDASTDIISYSNENISKAFYYGNSPVDSNNIAGISIGNTGNNGKALILGFDLDRQSPVVLSEVLNRTIQYFDGVSTTLKDKPLVTPNKHKLYKNFPNPFNPTTKISFQLPVNSIVKITVFDLAGREVTTLVNNKNMQRGFHSIEWDGKSSMGINVASGVYFYTLKSGKFSKTRKMILIR